MWTACIHGNNTTKDEKNKYIYIYIYISVATRNSLHRYRDSLDDENEICFPIINSLVKLRKMRVSGYFI